MRLIGEIKFQPRVYGKKKECWGKCETWQKHFKVIISQKTFVDFNIFAETVIHELLHLALVTITGMSKSDISDAAQHRIIASVSPKIMKGIKKYRKREVP